MKTMASLLIGLVLTTIFCPASAQYSKTYSGVKVIEYATDDGTITITLPECLPRGKIATGRVAIKPESDNLRIREQQFERLRSYRISLGQQVPLREGLFVNELPDLSNLTFEIKNFRGQTVFSETIEPGGPKLNYELTIPGTLILEKYERITGNFWGDASNARLTLNGQPVSIVAAREGELYFMVENGDSGKNNLRLEYGELVAEKEVNLVSLNLQAGPLALNRGESSFLNVMVNGLEGIQEPLTLTINNRSPETVSLEGGNNQTILLGPEVLLKKESWEKQFGIQSFRKGTFAITADLEKMSAGENHNEAPPIVPKQPPENGVNLSRTGIPISGNPDLYHSATNLVEWNVIELTGIEAKLINPRNNPPDYGNK